MKLLGISVISFLLVQGTLSTRVTLEGGAEGHMDKGVSKGTPALLACNIQASQSAGTAKFEWLYSKTKPLDGTHIIYDGTPADSNKFDRITVVSPYSIQIRDTVSSDSGFYTCRGIILGDTPSQATGYYNLTVLVPPYKQISCGFPSDNMLVLGSSAEFRCAEVVAQAVPAPTYAWYKNDVRLPFSATGNTQFKNSSFSYSSQTGVLRFEKVTNADEGTYYCTASNSEGTEQCNAATIKTKQQDVGKIVGIVFGVIFGIILIGVLIWWSWRQGYCDSLFSGKEFDDDAPEDGANDIMLDGAGPLVTKEPSEFSNGNSHKDAVSYTDHRLPEGAVRVMP